MNIETMNALMMVLGIVGAVFGLYGVYFFIMAVFGVRRRAAAPEKEATTRFAVLVAARNEEKVIGALVDSLRAQEYPGELYDVYVAPNNCTDHTKSVAISHGAKIFEPKGVIRSKGEVLTQALDMIDKTGNYDAVCIFDADNLVHPGFLQRMNDARATGVRVAQGFRDSKNVTDSPISTCYSVCYWILSTFYNRGRDALGLSSVINGCGFMVDLSLLAEMGGWHTCTMTEDLEFTSQCVLAGERVRYVPAAVFYDEQPVTLRQSWKQRRRWSTGIAQGMELYARPLLRQGLRTRRWTCIDLALTQLNPIVQLVTLGTGALSLFLAGNLVFSAGLVPPALALILALGLLAGFIALCGLLVRCMLKAYYKGHSVESTGTSGAWFVLFLLSWIPINLISLFHKKTTWEAIDHNRVVSVIEMVRPAAVA